MNDEAGKICRAVTGEILGSRGTGSARLGRVLVVDPVVGSRLVLARALAQPDVVVAAATGIEDALGQLEKQPPVLILAALELGRSDGLSFLTTLRRTHPRIERALVTTRSGDDFFRRAIEQADLAFIVRSPWHGEALRRTIRELLVARRAPIEWKSIRLHGESSRPEEASTWISSSRSDLRRQQNVLQRLLTGLNSCERESQLIRLLHGELARHLGAISSLWVDEENDRAIRIPCPPAAAATVSSNSLEPEEIEALASVRRMSGVARLDGASRRGDRDTAARIRIGLSLRAGSHAPLRCIFWSAASRSVELIGLLEDVENGLRHAFRRIRGSEARAAAARNLAHRVSEDLRMPMGRLAHAIDRLRREAERVGLPSEWMDDISSESRQVMQTVEHLENAMHPEPLRPASTDR